MKKDNFKEIAMFLWMALKIVRPFVAGLVIAFILNILMNLIENKLLDTVKSKKTKRAISMLLSLAVFFTFIVVLLLLIIPQLQNTVNIFIDNMPQYEENVKEWMTNLKIDEDIIKQIEEGIQNIGDTALNYIKNNSETVMELTLGVASNVISMLIKAIIAFVFAIYLLAQKEKLASQFNKLLNAYLPKNKVEKISNIATLSNKICVHFVSGQCLEALILGSLCFLGMLLLGIPYALTISVLIGVTALIPIYGAFIGTIIGAFLIFMVSPIKALVFVLFIIVLQQLEGNLIYPKVIGKSVGLPGIWVFVVVTIGASLAGIVGMLISVPIASIIYNIIAIDVNKRLEKKSVKKVR